MAPEAVTGRPVSTSGDVYSLGILVEIVMEKFQHTFLTAPLRRLSVMCTAWDPTQRPSLTHVAHGIARLTQHLTPQQLSEKLMEE